MNPPRPIELLAPARNAEIAIEAIKHGADAIYMGAVSHGARSAAGNSISDIARVVEYAHRYLVKVYVTVNTIVYNHETESVRRLIHELYHAGVDALIVQDMSILRMDIPPISLHASTHCDIRTVAKAEFLARAGFSQLVLARELSLEEMAEIHSRVDVPLEAFVHGALCVSYSGDCQAGYATMGRSANRGECPQICRHKFDLTDASGKKLIEGKHLLSLRDLNRSAHLEAMMKAGISSFKIEGRLKDAAYVKNVVAAYRQLIDGIIDANPELYRRASIGHTSLSFTPDLDKSFNRGYTDYFTSGPRPTVKMASIDTPKWIGQPVGKVISSSHRGVKVRLSTPVANGDGLGYFNDMHLFQGFRVNRIDNDIIHPVQPLAITPGTTLYRNHDHIHSGMMESDTARRTIDISFMLRPIPHGAALDISDCHGHSASVSIAIDMDKARTPQNDARRDVLTKTGDTIYSVKSISDTLGQVFIPKSTLASLRREAISALEKSIRASYSYDYRRKEDKSAVLPSAQLTYHDNIANGIAGTFYRDHGAQSIAPAIETSSEKPESGRCVMTTRYCLRREMNRCRRTPEGALWPDELYLQSGPMKLRLTFDCTNCRMHVHTTK